jgi:hypothetical protein
VLIGSLALYPMAAGKAKDYPYLNFIVKKYMQPFGGI